MDKTYEMDGDIITSGKRITAPLDSKIEKTVNIIIIEKDKHSDRSEKGIDIVIEDKERVTSTLTVVENNGRFKGNRAVWQIDISVYLSKRILYK